jgi:flagellar biosynthetic protein FliQ
MTLSFIPKLLAMFLVFLLVGPWMLQTMIDFTRQLFSSIPQIIG